MTLNPNVKVSEEDLKKIAKHFYNTENLDFRCQNTPYGKLCMSTVSEKPLICVITSINGEKLAVCKTSKDGKPTEIKL